MKTALPFRPGRWAILLLTLVGIGFGTPLQSDPAVKYYCAYCGTSASSVQSLTGGTCARHPDGSHKGRHAVYEGSEQARYTCKYCGTTASSIQSLTGGTCARHPNGAHKGRHAPAR